jgi:DNA adenine methylase
MMHSLLETFQRGDFLITYDNADEVKDLARSHGFSMRLVPMKNTHHTEMQELVIGRDLSWMDQVQALINQKLDRKI